MGRSDSSRTCLTLKSTSAYVAHLAAWEGLYTAVSSCWPVAGGKRPAATAPQQSRPRSSHPAGSSLTCSCSLLKASWLPSRPFVKPKMVKKKKKTKTFIHRQSDQYIKIKQNWWKSPGVNDKVWRRFKGQILIPNIGYRSKWKTEHMLPSSFRKFLVHYIKKLEVLLMCNKSCCAEIAHNVSCKNRKAVVESNTQLASRVTNPKAWLHSEENE
ncbi:LOW QUALITY PROTEIN: large ribosomal subunit protein eL32-like [Ctenodactylus gundi]